MVSNKNERVKGRTLTYQGEALLRLWKMGHNLIPIEGKIPLVLWKRYQTNRVTADHIDYWQEQFMTPGRLVNWSLITGQTPYSAAHAIVVVDSDDEEAEGLVRRLCPETPCMQRTGGGWHRVYRRPPAGDTAYLGNRSRMWVGDKQYKLDVRADGGYILAPGSVHRSGRVYEEVTPWTPALIAQCPVYDPAWIVEGKEPHSSRTRTTPPPPSRTSDGLRFDDEEFLLRFAHIRVPVEQRIYQGNRYLATVPCTVKGEGANGDCMSLTYRLLYGFALPPGDAFEAMCDWGRRDGHTCEDGKPYPWSEKEIRGKVLYAMANKDEDKNLIGGKLWTTGVGGDVEDAVGEAKAEEEVAAGPAGTPGASRRPSPPPTCPPSPSRFWRRYAHGTTGCVRPSPTTSRCR